MIGVADWVVHFELLKKMNEMKKTKNEAVEYLYIFEVVRLLFLADCFLAKYRNVT